MILQTENQVMSIKNKLMPHISKMITSERASNLKYTAKSTKRKFLRKQPTVVYFHQVDDPYSHLLVQTLSGLIKNFDVKLICHVVPSPLTSVVPRSDELKSYSLLDCKELVRYYELKFPQNADFPHLESLQVANRILCSSENTEDFLKTAFEVGNILWLNDRTSLGKLKKSRRLLTDHKVNRLMEQNQKIRHRKGHYLGGMLYFEGEWYWGIDRLSLLCERLKIQNLQKKISNLPLLKLKPNDQFPSFELEESDRKIDFYFSFRSPYSYLAINRMFDISRKYNVPLNVKPILPMVMRGLGIPQNKKMYIVYDAARISKKLGEPFGKIADPLGKGIGKCLAIFEYAKKKGQEEEYLKNVTRGIWSEGIDVSRNSELSKLIKRLNLDWDTAKEYLKADDWKKWAEQNREGLFKLGLWGVPSFSIGNFHAWGQDRIWMLEEKLKQIC